MRILVGAGLLSVLVGCASAPGELPAAPPSRAGNLAPARAPRAGHDAAGLIGTWRLVSYEDRPDDGGPSRFLFGASPQGLLIYDPTGHMSIQIMKTPHPRPASGSEEEARPDEKIALFDAYVAYFGTYRVEEERGVVIHRVEGDLADVYIGRDQERPYVLSGDRLELRPRWAADGKGWLGIRVFERVR
jgi:hypothetical protein